MCKLTQIHLQMFYTHNKQLWFYGMWSVMAIFTSNIFIYFKLKLILPVQKSEKDSWKKREKKWKEVIKICFIIND